MKNAPTEIKGQYLAYIRQYDLVSHHYFFFTGFTACAPAAFVGRSNDACFR